MAARPISEDEFRKALDLYCVGSGVTASEGEDHGLKRFLLSPGDIIVRLEEGRIITDSQSTFEKISEILMEVRLEEAPPSDEDLAKLQEERRAANARTQQNPSIYDAIVDRFGYDLLEVFGETGTLKSKGMVSLALETAKAGRGVFYLDTENNLTPGEVTDLKAAGVTYQYTPVLSQIERIILQDIPKSKASLIVVDSVGMPILRKFASMSAKERGDALLDLICWLGVLKEWSFNNHGLAFVTNQPKSEFGKTSASERGDNREAFGDKGNFIPGHILLSKKDQDAKGLSKGRFVAFRSRALAKGETIFTVTVQGGKPGLEMVGGA